ncbi:MAG TPA: dTMP kinase [Acidimicrobiales bacterium]
MARFIVFEGGEASGKSTQSTRLARRLGAVHTREPGGTEIGAALRNLLLDARTTGLDDRAEALLMAADRAQHVAEVIRPALAAGRHVVCDRYIGSTLAYQGHGRGLPVADLRRISAWAAGDLWPDLIILLAVPREVALGRAPTAPDRMEAAGDEFHDRVARGYRTLASADPARWVTIDGSAPAGDVEAEVWAAVASRLPDLASAGAGERSGDTPPAGPGARR